jgi:UDP-N-acetylmuramoyl-tripeptide--D-alanyl-D-alanine ligase
MIILYPIWLLLASFGILPLERFLKHRIIAQAKQKVAQFPNLIVIGITGSYGKTSVKEMLKAMLETSCTVIATPGTHNTPLGISEFILQHLTAHTEIMIVEMGAYLPGDITQLCEIVKPHIAVLT